MELTPDEANRVRRAGLFGELWIRLIEHPLSQVGPGLITGVADDDPSGIATYSQPARNSASTSSGPCRWLFH